MPKNTAIALTPAQKSVRYPTEYPYRERPQRPVNNRHYRRLEAHHFRGSAKYKPKENIEKTPQKDYKETMQQNTASQNQIDAVEGEKVSRNKAQIKNKYNIDYDHSLEDEYEIIEAID
ncbi:unnamed protein product [Hermetia illucens]|uniref:Uncharacterized protein n=1 Tax=Hermetia illucens TaxID=343691 RepID=A0A7R8YR06_HERIL|nr:unnamed protein product [Hermetia illucens]